MTEHATMSNQYSGESTMLCPTSKNSQEKTSGSDFLEQHDTRVDAMKKGRVTFDLDLTHLRERWRY